MLVWSNSTHWLKRECAHKFFTALTRLTFLSIYSVVTLQIRSSSPKSNHFFAPSLWCICASSVKFQPLVKEILCTQTFYFNNKDPLGSSLSIYNVVTLKISSRSPKSNHLFPLSWCICASFVKFQPLVKEIVCTQTFFCLFPALRKKLQRAITPSPYFLLYRCISLISMCLQKLMNIHHCVFKILGKNQRRGRTDGRTDGQTDGQTDGRTTWKQYTPLPDKQSLGYNYQDFMERGKVLTTKLLSQGYQKTKLVATPKKFYAGHHDLVSPYFVAVSRIVSDVFANYAP